MISSLLISLYRFNKFRKYVISLCKKLEHGEFHSSTLRAIFTKYHQIDIGLYSYGCFAPDHIRPGTTFGRYCSIAEGLSIFNANHPFQRLSTHPFFYLPSLGFVKDELLDRHEVTIGHDVWIGKNVIITPSVHRVGNGAVIGAGSVVTKDVPDYAIVAGNPARIIKYRFSPEKIEEINNSKWWLEDIKDLTIADFIKDYQP